MPEFLVPPKYKEIFNEYDLSVIKADHYVALREDLQTYRRQFVSRLKQRYPMPRLLPPSILETIKKIEQLNDDEFHELMRVFRYA